MATPTVTDGRSLIDEADGTTGWTGSSSPTADTTNYIESTASLGMPVSTSTDNLYHLHGSTVDLTGTLVYVWILANGAMDTLVNGGIALQLGDGTNRIGFHLAGSNAAAFRHNDGPVGWQCLCLDGSNLPSNTTAYAGTLGSFSITGVTQFGSGFKTLSKALGGANNCFTDIIRYGNQGITATGGTSGDPINFTGIAAVDRSTGNLQAYGIIRQLVPGAFGLQGPLTIGDSAGTAATYFYATNAVVNFEALLGGITATIYKFTVQGNATGSTTFKLGDKVGTGDTATGSNGCTILSPSGVGAEFIASDTDLQFLLLYGSTLKGFTQGVTFSSDATNGPNHEFMGGLIDSCGQFVPGRAVIRTSTISGYAGTAGALRWDANTNIKNCTFSNNTHGTNNPAAIEHVTTGSFTYDNLTFSGNDLDILNSNNASTEDSYAEGNSDGTVNLNGTNNARSQSFTATNSQLVSSASFYLSKTGSPTGNAVAKLYTITGTHGTNAVPATLLATSKAFDVTTLTGSLAVTRFEFDDSEFYTLTATNNYAIAVEYTGGDGSNYISVGRDASAPSHGGNGATYTTSWTSDSNDTIFYVFSGGEVTINSQNGSNPSESKVSNTGTPPGVVNINNSVALTINVQDVNKDPIQNAQCSIFLLNSPYTQLMNEDSTAGGVATEPYNYPGSPVDIVVKVRKSNTADNPRYEAFSATGQITASGFSLTVTLRVNPILQ